MIFCILQFGTDSTKWARAHVCLSD